MNMDSTDKCRRLADAILAWFGKGIIIDRQTQHYIDTCFPEFPMEGIGDHICDAPDLDTASIMDLIFFPDEELQMELEPMLEVEMYDLDNEATTISLLEAETIETVIRGGRCPNTVSLRVPCSSLEAFVRRLGIAKHIPKGLADTIAGMYGTETATRLKVLLRNTRIELDGPAEEFLEAFFLGMDSGAEDFNDCFLLVLELLGESGSEKDPFRLLRLKTDALHEVKTAARRFEEQLRRSNMETLMHQGLRAPEVSAAEAEKKIFLLDRIGRAAALGGCEARRRRASRSTARGQLEPKNGSFLP
jgi:hypothetical protein